MAWLMRHAMAPYERHVAERKRLLFAGLHGQAIEIGCGTRANLPYLSPAVHWIGTDPNPYMRPPVCANAERLPFADATADLAISTLVLCSVRDPALALAEIRRVLKPDGRFVFLEHVAAPPGTIAHRSQHWMRPLCHCCADGCNPLRDTERAIRSAGFRQVQVEKFSLGWPHISGMAGDRLEG
jgi:SAM-dependent methyltransferase